MSPRLTMMLAVLAGLALVVAGIAVPFWMAPPGTEPALEAQRVADNQGMALAYVAGVFVSCIAIAPVIVMLTVRLFPLRPGAGVLAGVLMLFGLVLETAATLGSVARLVVAVPLAIQGDPAGLSLYQALTLQYLAVDFAGVALIYAAAVAYAVALWDLHRLSVALLLGSVALLVLGFLPPLAPVTLWMLAASIAAYGLAYVALGIASVRLTPMEYID